MLFDLPIPQKMLAHLGQFDSNFWQCRNMAELMLFQKELARKKPAQWYAINQLEAK